jgi:membrane-associated phospholipid phosphatase
VGGVGGVGGVGYAGYASPAVTDGLIKHRDGIVGNWLGATLNPVQRALDDPVNLQAWEPWVRGAIIDFDLVSHLHVTRHNESYTYIDPNTGATVNKTSNRSVSVWHMHMTNTGPGASPKATSSRVATFIRPTPAIFKQQLAFLDQYADLREDRAAEIVTQMVPQYAYWSSIVYLHPDRTKKTLELIDAALRLANYVEMRVKHALACRRANEYSNQVQPMILTPGHGSLPSGHATEVHMVARVLWELRGGTPGDALGVELMRQASRIAVNRTVAGMHFPVDTVAGQMLGLTLARYFVRRAKGNTGFRAWRFDGERYPGTLDFDFNDLYNTNTAQQKSSSYVDLLPAQPLPEGSAILRWLWNEAANEWA